MRYSHLLVAAIVVFLLSLSQVSAHFVLPNVSSIPPWLRPNFTGIPAWKGFENFTGCHFGERREGLGNLKKYFQRFGYIQDLPSNVTDDFDDSLESAIKTYQQNFNMQQTGQLDIETVQQILRPRCGNADIVNGSTTMNAGKPVAVNTTHFRTVGHYSFFPGTPTPMWPSNRRDLTYAFDPRNELSNEVKNVFATAFRKWSEVIPMTFTQTESFTTSDIKIGFYSGDHGDGEPFDGVLGTLAHAFSPTNGRFHLDAEENWVVSGDIRTSTVNSAVDLESVAVHEIGHLLGLGHSSIENAIMYPSISSGTRKVELASDDIEGIQSLYGSNPNYNGSSSPSVQARETSDNGGAYTYRVGSWWWGLTLSLLMAARLVDIILF